MIVQRIKKLVRNKPKDRHNQEKIISKIIMMMNINKIVEIHKNNHKMIIYELYHF